jgi:hypothetical protein
LITILQNRGCAWNQYAYFCIPYLIASSVFAICYVFSGSSETARVVCLSLEAMNLDRSICDGAIAALGGYDFAIMSQYRRTLFIYVLLIFVPIFCYLYGIYQKKSRSVAIVCVLISLLPTIGLYIIAQDWGRWLHITALLTFVSLLAARPVDDRTTSQTSLKPLIIFFFYLTPALYIFYWKLPTAAQNFFSWDLFLSDLKQWILALWLH